NRVLRVGDEELSLFASLYDSPGTPTTEARLPVLHSRESVRVLQRFAEQPLKLGDNPDHYVATEMWHETNSQRDGTIGRETRFPNDISEWMLQGPHFYAGALFNKTPNEHCGSPQDYTSLDIGSLPGNYLPRTNYVPDCPASTYAARVPKWKGRPLTEFYRHVNRRQVSFTGERGLVACVIPPGLGHIDAAVSIAFSSDDELMSFSFGALSLPMDFFVRTTGKGDCRADLAKDMPLLQAVLANEANARVLRLNCITEPYSTLWERMWNPKFKEDSFASRDVRMESFRALSAKWSRDSALRTDLARRQALLELDVLAAMSLGVSEEELLSIYRAHYYVMQDNSESRVCGQDGRFVPTSKTAARKPAVSLVELAATLKEQAGFDVHAEYHPDGSNTQELRKQKVRLGKKEADVLGVSERCTMADLLAETEVRWSDEDHPEGRPVRLVGLRYTDPGLEPRMERIYPTPWTRCDREADYRQAWAEFEHRLGKKMPESPESDSPNPKEPGKTS
ncbi:MAG: hypothetical protein JKY61_12280, partial [Planctomycetes bacterium]|nr:hypothetical protein [Planctomycetota bacterium]